MQGQRFFKQLQADFFLGAIGHATHHRPHFVDDFCVEGAQRNARFHMPGRQGNGFLQRFFHLLAEPLRQGLGHADALAVAAQGVGVPVPGVGVLRVGGSLGLGALGNLHEQREPRLLARLQVGGVHGRGLVGSRDARAACGQARFCRLLKLAVMEQHPGVQHGGVLGQGLRVSQVQLAPLLLHAGGIPGVVACVGEGGPRCHGCLRHVVVDRVVASQPAGGA